MVWKGESRRHSLARKGIRTTNGILDDIHKEVQALPQSKNNDNSKFGKWRSPEVFMPEIQAEIDKDEEFLKQLDYWNMDKTDHGILNDLLSNGQDGVLTYQIVQLTPQEYEDAIQYGFNKEYSDIKWRIDEHKLKGLLERIKDGKKVRLPYLYYGIYRAFGDHTKILGDFSQEGHHRAIISGMMGKETIPVMIAYPKSKGYQELVKQYMNPDIQEIIE